ncbi:MAG: GIY-YIG nuclease family protein [Leptospirales bacterium]|nr:GIY-YIG nuclease family protein [Leptospirales bacterium]
MWYVYIIQASNGALYTGITTDLQARFRKHQQGRGARFFRTTAPVAIVYAERKREKGAALRREATIKALSRQKKLALVRAGRQSIPHADLVPKNRRRPDPLSPRGGR